jgi:hypothetical protein
MASPALQIELDSDIEEGPLVRCMLGYDPKAFESYVINHMSDTARRKIVFENSDFREFVRKSFEGTGAVVTSRVADVEPVILKLRAGKSSRSFDAFGSPQSFPEPSRFRRMRPPTANFSGAEFADLAHVAITHGALGASGAAVGVAIVKAAKDVILKWMDGIGKKKVKVSVGAGRTIEITGSIDEAKMKQVTDILEEAVAANAGSAPAKARTATTPKRKPAARKKATPKKAANKKAARKTAARKTAARKKAKR